jgi:CheY-like chemotaxis protein
VRGLAGGASAGMTIDSQNPFGDAAAPRKPRLLIVDPHPSMRTLLADAARISGEFAEVHTARDGQEALDFVRRAGRGRGTDVVVTELYLPRLNGVELLLALQAPGGGHDIHGIVISVYDSPIERCAARIAGDAAFMRKPRNPAELQQLLALAAAPRRPPPPVPGLAN